MRLTWNIECSIYFHFLKIYLYFLKMKHKLYIGFVYMISQVILLAFMCFFNFENRPICKEVMNIYVMRSQSFCEYMYITPKGV